MQQICNTKDRVLSEYGNFVICYTGSAAHVDVPNEVDAPIRIRNGYSILKHGIPGCDLYISYRKCL